MKDCNFVDSLPMIFFIVMIVMFTFGLSLSEKYKYETIQIGIEHNYSIQDIEKLLKKSN